MNRPLNRPLIGVAVDAAMGHGRSILRGVMRHANIRRSWLIHEELRITNEALDAWPACDGVILAAGDCPLFDQIAAVAPELISCAGGGDPARAWVIRSDDHAVGRMGAEHLLECQLVHFGFYGRLGPTVPEDRFAGFSAAVREKGFACHRSPVVWPESYRWTDRHHWPELIEWLRGLPKPVGIMAMDDTSAHDLAAACLQGGLDVPGQVAIIGVNNDDLLCDSAWPPLSSVVTEPSRLGYEAAVLMERLLSGESRSGFDRVTYLKPVGVARRVSTDVLAIEDPQVVAAVRFIRENACKSCSVGDLLQYVPVNRRWLERQFARHLGRSPHEEILRVRVDAARRMLLQTDATLPEVAEKCGFGTVQTFGRQFHELTGETPAAWRRENRQRR
ncbi:MAG: substrate-binding domain-containing protein [Tepidisphaeraceae bacterium]